MSRHDGHLSTLPWPMIRGWLGYSHTLATALALSRSAVYKRMKAGQVAAWEASIPISPKAPAQRTAHQAGRSVIGAKGVLFEGDIDERSRPIKERFQQTE
jgi:hypothetical protein